MPPPKCAFDPWNPLGLKKEQALLDVGTGSGILAIYGVKLGFGRIEAIDVDPEAVRWALKGTWS
jgi:ribosomal protein L11 methylase PrmA